MLQRMATVRTHAGEDRYQKPIGSPLDDSRPSTSAPVAVPSALRIRTLRALILTKLSVGDSAAVRALTEKFRSEYAEFSRHSSGTAVDALQLAPLTSEK